MKLHTSLHAQTLALGIGLCIVLAPLSGCVSSNIPNDPRHTDTFTAVTKIDTANFLDREGLAAFEAESDPIYMLGEGDKISVQVWNRPELSGSQTIGPDGGITVPLLGSRRITSMSREEAANSIAKDLKRYYTTAIVNIGVEEYHANRITVLGRVLTPGVLQFDRPPMLLDALARAGSLPVLDKQATLTRCAIFRGREKIIWVDLKHLLNRGDLAYNIRLKPNDLIYIPDSFDTQVYVMGAVGRPGAYRLTPDMSLMDALAQAGGPTEDANDDEISLHRPGHDAVERLPIKALLASENRKNFSLEEGDVIYVPKKGIADVGYVMRQLLPGLSFMTFGAAVSGK